MCMYGLPKCSCHCMRLFYFNAKRKPIFRQVKQMCCTFCLTCPRVPMAAHPCLPIAPHRCLPVAAHRCPSLPSN